MAERRMFAKSIVLSDAFLDMPLSARCLYFTLGMLADDDGFIGSPKSIMRQCGATNDDMLILLQKRYILDCGDGVMVIKHWRMNNYLRNDRYRETTYLEEKAKLTIDEKGAYTELKNDDMSCGIPMVYPGKVSIGKYSIDKYSIDKYRDDDINNIKSRYEEIGYNSDLLSKADTIFAKYPNNQTKDFYIKIVECLTNDDIRDCEAYISQIARNEVQNANI